MKNNEEFAILIAAGKGERMRPLTLTTPKPLVKVNGTAMIETIIAGLKHRGISRIYVVVGYLKEKFEVLKAKYPEVILVENTEFNEKNNISSIHAVLDTFEHGNCLVCEADLYVSDVSIFETKFTHSCYFGKMIPGHSDDWVFDLDHDRITRVGKYGDDAYNMCGIAYLLPHDAKIIANAIREAYKHPGHEQLFWDQIVDQQLKNIYLTVNPVSPNQIVEIDSVAELKEIDNSYADVQ